MKNYFKQKELRIWQPILPYFKNSSMSLVLAYLMQEDPSDDNTKWFHIERNQIIENLGICDRTVTRCIKELKKLSFISTKHIGGMDRRLLYRINYNMIYDMIGNE